MVQEQENGFKNEIREFKNKIEIWVS